MREPNAKLFLLQRNEDETGVSGEGLVAEGVEFSDGQCVVRWLTDLTSLGIYQSLKEVEAIHGHGGKTIVVWK
jgi:hypothetical protein